MSNTIAVMNQSCGTAIAQAFMNQDLYLAWAGLDDSDNAWTNDPPLIDSTKTDFENEICRRLIQNKKYVIQDESGDITSAGLTWRESSVPTNCIMLTVRHELTDAPNSLVYKIGIFGGTKHDPSVTKNFLYPYNLVEKGYLIMSANIPELVRSPTVAESREIILRF